MKRARGFFVGLTALIAVTALGAAGYAALRTARPDPGAARCPCGLCADVTCRCVFEDQPDQPPSSASPRKP